MNKKEEDKLLDKLLHLVITKYADEQDLISSIICAIEDHIKQKPSQEILIFLIKFITDNKEMSKDSIKKLEEEKKRFRDDIRRLNEIEKKLVDLLDN